MKTLRIVLLLLLSSVASAQESWHDQQGRIAPNSEDRKVIHGFGGIVLVTSDADWKVKWETPSSTVPMFNIAKNVSRGSRVFVLVFFANPQLDRSGSANITCDIDSTRPDGSTSVHQADAECFKGVLKGDPHNTYLSAPVIGFVGDPGDPAGKWQVRVTLKDNNRHVTVPLTTSFVLVDK